MVNKSKTFGELKKSGYKVKSVKDEIRDNLIAAMEKKEDLFPGIIGYDDTVIPQVQNALLSKHDFIFLGLRGQAKSRILRELTNFLDDYIPVIDGCEINDDPFKPACKRCFDLHKELGDDLPISWLPKEKRYSEKLATPDVTISDLIGDIDPIKAASQKLHYSHEGAIHYGIIPRSNRGIFAINEIPDLQQRIQVGLLNIMQEKDIQIRGFPIRIPMDVLIVYSANPEDYTNRGNIITPLRDRISSQINTHYPLSLEDGMRITEQEAWTNRNGKKSSIVIPHYIKEIVEQTVIEARNSEYIDQKSGVSARMSITCMENLVSNIEKRQILLGEKSSKIRICDFEAMIPAIVGKIELVYEGEEEGAVNVARMMIGKAVKEVFGKIFPEVYVKKSETSHANEVYNKIKNWFNEGNKLDLSDSITSGEYFDLLNRIPGLKELAEKYFKISSKKEKDAVSCAMEFIIESLHQNSVLSKEHYVTGNSYGDLVDNIFSSLNSEDFEY